jgi:hypothetical protein
MKVLTKVGDSKYICNMPIPNQQAVDSLINEIVCIPTCEEIILCDPPAWVAAVVVSGRFGRVRVRIGNDVELVTPMRRLSSVEDLAEVELVTPTCTVNPQ